MNLAAAGADDSLEVKSSVHKTVRLVEEEHDPDKTLYEAVKTEVDAYLECYAGTAASDVEGLPFGAISWWGDKRADFPHVSEVARQFLCLPPSSEPSSSLFAVGDLMDHTKPIDPRGFIEQQMFIHRNYDRLKCDQHGILEDYIRLQKLKAV
eukprot:CAMPEP_0116540832 /NCGR_PEP_ID=MMETSP0397-20121206/160_1 /TAXON_ID=216820 /ORGANISM="Cyclophora tenuis, Strain ECT3854" /LENGTH=151 /DNA_ID=CAMNT_0004064735 /DNA_START=459 /DNA_END=914 /DNA_ORIENTATION=+